MGNKIKIVIIAALILAAATSAFCVPPKKRPAERKVYYSQDFGGNSISDDSVSLVPINECRYRMNRADESSCGTYSLRKRGLFNGDPRYLSQWYRQIDHTHPKESNRGYFLQLDGSLDNDIFYTFSIEGFAPNERISFSFWIVNCYTSWQKRVWERDHWRVQPPDFDIIIIDENENERERVRIGPVPFDNVNLGATDYQCSAEWHCVGFDFYTPDDASKLTVLFQNRGTGSPGNDFGIDDILVFGYR